MAYFGQLQYDGNTYLVGSSLYGRCKTARTTTLKEVRDGVLGNSFDECIEGITVNIQFIYGNSVDAIKLKIGNTIALDVVGNCKCNTNAVLSFTYGQVNGSYTWILNAGEKTATTVMQTYDATSTEPISGKGVAEAIAPLVPGGNSAANYSVDSYIGINPSSATVPTTLAVANYVNDSFARKGALLYKGQMNNHASLPTTYDVGWVYKVNTAGTYVGQKCEVGDLLISINNSTNDELSNDDWVVIQTNIHNPISGPSSATQGHVAVFGTSEREIEDSGHTIETSVPANAVFTDTQYESSGSAQAITNITEGSDLTLVSISQGVLTLKSGLSFTKTNVSTGIREVQ